MEENNYQYTQEQPMSFDQQPTSPQPPAPQKKGEKKAVLTAVIALILVAAIVAGTVFLLVPMVKEKNQQAADEVIVMIDELDGEKITPDSEDKINAAKENYDGLSDKQKELVSNYSELEKAMDSLKKVKDKAAKDQQAADEVIEIISNLEGRTVTVGLESEINRAKAKYNALTDDQKALVTNYTVLVIAAEQLIGAQDAEAAKELVNAIDRIDRNSLGTDSTQIDALLSRYKQLTDDQKLLVSNYDTLLEYQSIVKKNANAKAKKEKGVALANNFGGYTGKWGDFGSHKSSYQGMIEAAVKNANVLRKYFYCDPNPNYLDMYVSRFTRDTSGFGIGSCYIEFTGIGKDDGFTRTLAGEIYIKSDGTVTYNVSYFY